MSRIGLSIELVNCFDWIWLFGNLEQLLWFFPIGIAILLNSAVHFGRCNYFDRCWLFGNLDEFHWILSDGSVIL